MNRQVREIIVDSFAGGGNAVPPPFAEHLVRANLPELCTGKGTGSAVDPRQLAIF